MAGARASPTRADLPRPRRWRGQAWRGRARAGGAPHGGHARGGGGGTRERDGEAWGVEPPAVDGRLGARSSAMTKATTQPAVRAEGRSPRRARSPPAWRIETSLRRKAVRGGGSRRACGAPVCLRQEGAAGAGGASEPSSTSIPIEGVTLLPFRSHSDHVSTGPDGRSTRAISRRAASAPQLLASVSEGFRAVGGDRHQLWYLTI